MPATEGVKDGPDGASPPEGGACCPKVIGGALSNSRGGGAGFPSMKSLQFYGATEGVAPG